MPVLLRRRGVRVASSARVLGWPVAARPTRGGQPVRPDQEQAVGTRPVDRGVPYRQVGDGKNLGHHHSPSPKNGVLARQGTCRNNLAIPWE